MRVFVSSTVYDLVDVRTEIAELLRSMGIAPVLSDDKLSDFAVRQDANSIESCLINVDSSDEVIVILDQRYGPRLSEAGFGDVSATHLEYKRALERRIPTHVYVRDRLYADHAVWKKNGRADSLRLEWVKNPKDFALFGLIDEHVALNAESRTSNWITPFSTSVDLKAAIRRRLEKRILPERLLDAIHKNQFPVMDIEVEVSQGSTGLFGSLSFKVVVTNVGGAPAFNCCLYFVDDDETPERRHILASGSRMLRSFYYTLDKKRECPMQYLIAQYESPIGVSVKDTFEVGGRILGGGAPILISGGKLVDRKFKRVPPVTLELDDG